MEPKIIFEDDSLLVLEKPAGLVVDKSETQQTGTLENWLEERLNNPELLRSGIVHRLDKDTSGLILAAKTPAALENLQSQFAERETQKEYLTLVHGQIKDRGEVGGSIGRNPREREKFVVFPNNEAGKEALTIYEPIDIYQLPATSYQQLFTNFSKIQLRKLDRNNYGIFTLVRCFPKTGRTHQIRVHLKYIGHPLVADEKYGGRKTYRLDKRWCPRQFLHAHKITFKHPVTGEDMTFESQLPTDLQVALNNLQATSHQ